MQGQYCLASAEFSPTTESYAAFYDGDHSRDYDRPGPFDFVWDSVKVSISSQKSQFLNISAKSRAYLV